MSTGPANTREAREMLAIARKNRPKKSLIRRLLNPPHAKIKLILAIYIFDFIASCLAANISHQSILIATIIEIMILLSLLAAYLGLRSNLKNKYKYIISIILTILDFFFIFVVACEIIYLTK